MVPVKATADFLNGHEWLKKTAIKMYLLEQETSNFSSHFQLGFWFYYLFKRKAAMEQKGTLLR